MTIVVARAHMTGRNYKTIIHIIKININKLIVQERVFMTFMPKSFVQYWQWYDLKRISWIGRIERIRDNRKMKTFSSTSNFHSKHKSFLLLKTLTFGISRDYQKVVQVYSVQFSQCSTQVGIAHLNYCFHLDL